MPADSVSRKAAIGATWLIAWRFVTRALGVASTLVMAHILVPADFGLVAMATAFSGAVDALSQMGLSQALIRRKEDDEGLHDAAFTLQVVRAVATGVLLAALAPATSTWFNEPRLTPIILVLAALSALSGFRNIGVVAYGRSMHYGRQVAILAAPRVLQVLITIPLALLIRNYWVLVLGMVLGRVLDVAVTYVMHPYRPRFSLAGWRELASFSFWTWAAGLASIVWDRCDPFVIGPALGTAQLGIFLIAAEIAALPITEMVSPAADVLFAGFSMAQKDGSRPVAMALPAATALMLVVMPVAVAVSCTASYIVAVVLGPNWAAAQPLIAVMACMGLFSPFSFVCTTALVSGGYLRTNFVANCLASALKLAALSIAVTLTHDLPTIVLVATLVFAGEASAYVVLLVRTGEACLRECVAPLSRILAAGIATTALAAALGLSFRRVDLAPLQALAIGAPLGIGCIAVCVALVAIAWVLAGRPEGPETRMVRLLTQLVQPVTIRVAAIRSRLPIVNLR